MIQLFAKEVLWYEVLSPSLTKIYPEMKELSPNCLYSSCNNFQETKKEPHFFKEFLENSMEEYSTKVKKESF